MAPFTPLSLAELALAAMSGMPANTSFGGPGAMAPGIIPFLAFSAGVR